jgi:hypothetical protein
MGTKLGFVTQPSNVAPNMIMPSVVVKIQNNDNTTDTTATDDVTLAISANPGSSVLLGTLTVAAVNGIATFSNLSLNNLASNYTLIATATGLTSVISNPFNVVVGSFATAQEIATYIGAIDSTFILSSVSSIILDATTRLIQQKTEKTWSINYGPLYLDGRGEDFIFSPVTPIASLTGVFIIAPDLSEDSLTVSGVDRQVWFNEETGEIKFIDADVFDIVRDSVGSRFTKGIKNIRIEGVFGVDASSAPTLKLLQCLLYLQLLGLQNSEFLVGDIKSEKIGEYSYQLSDMEKSGNPKNQKKTLEGWINDLIDSLRDTDNSFLAI